GTVLLVSHDRALLDAVGERTLAIEDGRLNSYDGGWAEYVRRRAAAEREVPPPTIAVSEKPVKVRKAPPQPKQAPDLERIEAEMAEREGAVAELERKLADDWSDVELLAAHRRAREELHALLQRWETLFERARG